MRRACTDGRPSTEVPDGTFRDYIAPVPQRTFRNRTHRRTTIRRRRSGPRPQRELGNEPRTNDQIRVPRVLVIDDEGNKLGEFLTRDAVQLARDRGLDLVEVAPNGKPPVCRIADYGKMRYDRKKRDAAARKRQHNAQLKEIKVRPKTDDHDMDVKIRRAHQFLSEGNKVKVTVRFRGREHAHHNIGADQCHRLFDAVSELAVIESPPRMEGRQMTMIMAPSRRPVERDSDSGSDDSGDTDDDQPEATAEAG